MIQSNVIQLEVKRLKGANFKVQLDNSSQKLKILDLKKKIFAQQKISIQTQRINYKGKNTKDQDLLTQWNISHGDSITLMELIKKQISNKPKQQLVQPMKIKQEKKQHKKQEKKQNKIKDKEAVKGQKDSNEEQDQKDKKQQIDNQFQKNLQKLIEMRFNEKDAKNALIASFNNLQLSISYLTGDQKTIEQVKKQQKVQNSVLVLFWNKMQDRNDFKLVKKAIQKNPDLIDDFITSIQHTAPELYKIILKNPHAFQKVIVSDEKDSSSTNELINLLNSLINVPNTENQKLNEIDEQNIEMIVNMGFQKKKSQEAYLRANKNIERAISILTENNRQQSIAQKV